MDRSGWETEKKSWLEERSGADAEGPPYGDIFERFGKSKEQKGWEERSVGSLGGWKPLSQTGWTTTPDIWTNEVANCDNLAMLTFVSRFQVESPVITIDNYKRYLDNGIGGRGLHEKKKNFEKVVKGRIRVAAADQNSPPHLIINRP